MADDRLDDAIDAVVRAVDRIERATRQAAPTPAQLSDATRPIQAGQNAAGAFWAPREGQGEQPTQATPYGQPAPGQTTNFAQPAPTPGQTTNFAQPAPGQTGNFDSGAGLGQGLGGGLGVRPQTTAEFSALGAAAVQPYAEHGASPEVHELVGRIVGRMQALDDHLAAASGLRSEISELVARLAAAAGTSR